MRTALEALQATVAGKSPKQIADLLTKLQCFQVVAKANHGGSWIDAVGNMRCQCGCEDFALLELSHERHDGNRHRKSLGKGGQGAGMRVYRVVARSGVGTVKKLKLSLRCVVCHRLLREGLL